jgi:hypothetical protein
MKLDMRSHSHTRPRTGHRHRRVAHGGAGAAGKGKALQGAAGVGVREEHVEAEAGRGRGNTEACRSTLLPPTASCLLPAVFCVEPMSDVACEPPGQRPAFAFTSAVTSRRSNHHHHRLIPCPPLPPAPRPLPPPVLHFHIVLVSCLSTVVSRVSTNRNREDEWASEKTS